MLQLTIPDSDASVHNKRFWQPRIILSRTPRHPAGRVVSGTNKTAKKRTRGKSLARASLEHQNPLLASNPELGQNTARIDSGNQESIRHRTHNKCEFGKPKTHHLLIAAGNWDETNISAGTRGPNSKNIFAQANSH